MVIAAVPLGTQYSMLPQPGHGPQAPPAHDLRTREGLLRDAAVPARTHARGRAGLLRFWGPPISSNLGAGLPGWWTGHLRAQKLARRPSAGGAWIWPAAQWTRVGCMWIRTR